MRKVLLMAMVLAMTPVAVDAQGPPRQRQQSEAAQERRAELEQQVRRQFLAQLADRLDLSATQHDRLDTVLRNGADARRTLARESHELRIELMRAAHADGTPVATFEDLLERMDALRDRERALERREAAALAEFLDARQRALFLTMRMQLNERVRRMQREGRRPGGTPRGGADFPGMPF